MVSGHSQCGHQVQTLPTMVDLAVVAAMCESIPFHSSSFIHSFCGTSHPKFASTTPRNNPSRVREQDDRDITDATQVRWLALFIPKSRISPASCAPCTFTCSARTLRARPAALVELFVKHNYPPAALHGDKKRRHHSEKEGTRTVLIVTCIL